MVSFLPRILSLAIPVFIYLSLIVVACGIYRERKKLDRWALILGVGAFIASMAYRPNEHLLFFDEDIYIQIAANLSHRPIAQLTLLGGPGDIQASTYYKEPAGFPALLSMVFLFTGVRESVAFVFARVLYALTVAAVYLLAKHLLKNTSQAMTAAFVFAAAPACFAYSSSAGTDLPAALFSTLGVYGILSGNNLLATGGLAMAAQVRLDMIVLAPLVLLANQMSARWKVAFAGLIAPEVLHVLWVLSIAPTLAKAEQVESAFSASYVVRNLAGSARYLFNPSVFPLVATITAILGTIQRKAFHRVVFVWFGLLFGLYLLFYAGSFSVNPRYSIQVSIPIVLLAASLSDRKVILFAIAAGAGLTGLRPWIPPSFVQTLEADHRTAVPFAEALTSTDLVLSSEPEVFLNHGKQAMNSVYATEQPQRLRGQFGRFTRILYYAGARTMVEGSQQWEADRRLKAAHKLELIDSRVVDGARIALYELRHF